MLHFQGWHILLVLVVALMTAPPGASNFLEASQSLNQEPSTVLSVSPATAAFAVGDTQELQVNIANPVNLYAFEVGLAFDANTLQIEDESEARSGVQIELGSLFSSRIHFVATHVVDNTAGTIRIATTLLGAETPINTDGNLLNLTIRGAADGTSQVAISSFILTDNLANVMPANTEDSTIVVGAGISPSPTPDPAAPELTNRIYLPLLNRQ